MKLEGKVFCEAPDCELSAHVGPDTMELPVAALSAGGAPGPEADRSTEGER